MRLSFILLVTATFVAGLDFTAASDASAVNVVKSTNVHQSFENTRSLRIHKEDDDLSDDDDLFDDDEEEEERMFSAMADKARAIAAAAKLSGKSGDDLLEAISALGKKEVNALYSQGQSHVAKLVPGFHSGMSLDDFVAAMRSAGLADEIEEALKLSYSKYLAHNM